MFTGGIFKVPDHFSSREFGEEGLGGIGGRGGGEFDSHSPLNALDGDLEKGPITSGCGVAGFENGVDELPITLPTTI